MSSAKPPVTFTLDADRIGWIVFDDPESRANVLNTATQSALDAAITAAERGRARALVIMSGKDRIFIAGADLKVLAAMPDAETATEFSRHGQQLFQRLSDFSGPVICAIHGACAGGGCELALACHWRIASDAEVTRIGLPETSIGTIPGWGGCVRLPRLIGVQPALEHILAGQLLTAAEAAAAGIVNEVVAVAELKTCARDAALKLAAEGLPTHAPRAAPVPTVFADLRKKISARARGDLRAPLAAIDAVEQTAQLAIPAALEIEARVFGEVTAGDTCKNLIRVFFLREAAKKRTLDGWFETVGGALRPDSGVVRQASRGVKPLPQPIRRVVVVGAGVMGSGIAQWLAARGFDVVLRDVSAELVDRGHAVARGLFDEAVKRGKLSPGEANAALHRIATTTAWDGFAECDLVIEAIVENTEAKRRLFSEIAAIVRGDAILASNTSALPIEDIAGHVSNPHRTIGIHFFNPVNRMPLVELIVGRHTSVETAERALTLVKALGKSPIICRSSPGFLVTRVLFFYLNEAVRLWEQGLPTAAIDDALRDFGWPMGPLRLVDEVGIDVTDFIFGELAHYFPQRFTRATATTRLLAAGMKGRKNGASTGFYTYSPREALNDTMTRQVAGRLGEFTLSAEEITERLMHVMVAEAQRCLDEGVVKSADDVDFALLSGAGFSAWRGGLMQWARGRKS
jgi:3-hydroxyacyl-CoA dehydrogenase / enoyl-CoA hydratase / 3-hydroxybutyryl-CoA epimerase